MKRTNIHIFAAIALLLGLAACTQDEAGFLPEGAEGRSIVFTATGLTPAATATAGTPCPGGRHWGGCAERGSPDGRHGEGIRRDALHRRQHQRHADLHRPVLLDQPQQHHSHSVVALHRWRDNPTCGKGKANQSAQKDFEGSDLIVADGQTVTYGSPTLRFTHRTARVTIVLTDYTEGLASVQLTGLSTKGDNPDIIVPYDKGSNTYTALVAPQSVAAGTAFITCTFTNGKTFVYKMKNAAYWQAGGEYTYTVSLAAEKGYIIEDDGSYTVTSTDGLMNVAELVKGGKTDINITLTADIDLTGKKLDADRHKFQQQIHRHLSTVAVIPSRG